MHSVNALAGIYFGNVNSRSIAWKRGSLRKERMHL